MKTIVGYKRIDYTKKDGSNVKGYTIYVVDDNKNGEIDNSVEGIITDNFYVNDEIFNNIVNVLKSHDMQVLNGEFLEYKYNRFGRVCGVLFD